MNNSQPKIIVVHDDLHIKDPLLVVLKEQYGEQNVILFKKSQEGTDYILNNLNQKMIVILDFNFKPGEPSGLDVFLEIRKKTSLVFVIIMTASDINVIKKEELIQFINNDALAFEHSTTDYSKIVSLVDKADHQLSVRVDSVLEEWITQQPGDELNKPYLLTKEGKQYTLNEILESIRLQEALGKKMERNILKLAVDLLSRKKEKIDD